MEKLTHFTEIPNWKLEEVAKATHFIVDMVRARLADFGTTAWRVPTTEAYLNWFRKNPQSPFNLGSGLNGVEIYPPNTPNRFKPIFDPDEERVFWVKPEPRLRLWDIMPPDTRALDTATLQDIDMETLSLSQLKVMHDLEELFWDDKKPWFHIEYDNRTVRFHRERFAEPTYVAAIPEGVPSYLVREWQ